MTFNYVSCYIIVRSKTCKEKTSKLKFFDENMKNNEDAVVEQLKEKNRLAMLLKEAQLQASKSDAKSEELRNKHELEKNKQRASEKYMKTIFKRHTTQFTDKADPSKSFF